MAIVALGCVPSDPPASGGASFAYVANIDLGAIQKIDTVTLDVVTTIDVGGSIGGSIALQGTRIYYLTRISASSGAVAYYDIATGQNNRAFITSGLNGSLLRTSPALPGRLFIGATGVSPGSIRVYDTTGPTGSWIASTEHTSLGGGLNDFRISADGSKVWVAAAGGPNAVTELRSSDLTLTGRQFPTGPFPTAVTSTIVAGREVIAAGTDSSEMAHVFDAADPSTVVPTALAGDTGERSMAFSRDGSLLYSVVEGSSKSELVTMTPRTDILLRAPLSNVARPSMGEVKVDPGTGRVFVLADNSITIYNPDGTYGRTLTQAAPRSIVFSATGPTSNPPRLQSSTSDTGPPVITAFNTSRATGPVPLTAAFSWTISDPDPGALVCYLDLDANGYYEETISPCTSSSVRSASYTWQGPRSVQILVTDGISTASRTVLLSVSAPTPDHFAITTRTSASMSASQRSAFEFAAMIWQQAIGSGLPDTSVNVSANDCADGAPAFIDVVDDLQIDAIILPIDGPGGRVGMTRPCVIRSASGLPAYGVMEFDSADVPALESAGAFSTLVLHEMGHVLGFGTGPKWAALVSGGGTADPRFTGAIARGAWSALGGTAPAVPVENTGGPGTADGHWRESALGNELMTGYLNPGYNPLSRITIGALGDIGYDVDLGTGGGYSLPSQTFPAAVSPPSELGMTTLAPKFVV